MYDWDEKKEPDGRLVARLGGTRVIVSRSAAGLPGEWSWEVDFADGQVQKGFAKDPDEALRKGKQVAERFLP